MEFCRYEKKDHVAYITITRPEVMNALHAHASREMGGVFDDFAADDDAWVAVLTGEGDRAFSAGNDLKYTAEMSRLPREQRPDLSMPPGGFGGITSRFDLFKPVIARVNGFALGGGLEMALGVHRLPRHLPIKQAMGYLLTGRHIPAQRAYEMGLVNEVVPLAKLDDAVAAWVADIVRCAPLSVRATKEAAMRGLQMPLEEAATARYEWEMARRQSADAVEGPRAFAEKRAPNWTGK
jgi:enoyl-CoA hydratase/carnithine racemase